MCRLSLHTFSVPPGNNAAIFYIPVKAQVDIHTSKNYIRLQLSIYDVLYNIYIESSHGQCQRNYARFHVQCQQPET